MKEFKLKSFDFASDLTKQLITLSTILIGLSITFFEKFGNSANERFLIGSWILLFLSIIFGILTLMALTGIIGKIKNDDDANTVDIYGSNVTAFSVIQVVTFLFGILLVIIYSSFSSKKDNSSTKL